jgi:hypothetical protein
VGVVIASRYGFASAAKLAERILFMQPGLQHLLNVWKQK